MVVEYHPPIDVDVDADAEGMDLISRLASELAGSHTENEWLEVTAYRITVDAASASDAIKRATAALTRLHSRYGVRMSSLVRAEATPESWVDRFQLAASPLIGLTELAHRAGVSRQRIAQLAQRHDFPRPIARLASGPVWAAGPALDWLARPRPVGRPRAPQVRGTVRGERTVRSGRS